MLTVTTTKGKQVNLTVTPVGVRTGDASGLWHIGSRNRLGYVKQIEMVGGDRSSRGMGLGRVMDRCR